MNNPFTDPDYLKVAELFRNDYQIAIPFPNVVIDNFLPIDIANQALARYPDLTKIGHSAEKPGKMDWVRGKFGYFGIPTGFEEIFEAFLSTEFVRFLELLTGETNLIPDRELGGAGLHEITCGGFLKVHVDYNLFKKHVKPLLRRINLLYFLNNDWPEAYGGHLELWEKPAKKPTVRILPIFNRCVIFQASDKSFHGHPNPLSCPPDRKRRAMAFYYFIDPGSNPPERHGTLYIDT